MGSYTVEGQIVDVVRGKIYPGIVRVEEDKIFSITPVDKIESSHFYRR
jgi:hypothetical protein